MMTANFQHPTLLLMCTGKTNKLISNYFDSTCTISIEWDDDADWKRLSHQSAESCRVIRFKNEIYELKWKLKRILFGIPNMHLLLLSQQNNRAIACTRRFVQVSNCCLFILYFPVYTHTQPLFHSSRLIKEESQIVFAA